MSAPLRSLLEREIYWTDLIPIPDTALESAFYQICNKALRSTAPEPLD